MSFTKSIFTATICSASLLTSALAVADAETTAFQADKDHQIAKILERIQIDQKNLSCVQNAQDEPSLKACVETVKQAHEAAEPKPAAPAAPVCDKKPGKDVTNKKKK
jgi:hypothetical protein